ncbi:MAG: T9SS type A sorting domain-containing protein [Bacteroidales bacterium]|nr:T9SS type A sorting domain-containing protein [Bacteroidales bacterium]
MKLNIFITAILIIFQVTHTIGQDFAPIGAEWYYSSSAGGTAPTASEYYYLLVEKDTMINDLNLRKIKRTYCRYQDDSLEVSPYLIHESGDTISLYDQANMKLYRLFVFNASQGDTLVLDIPFDNNYTEDSTYRVVIDTIVAETYDGTELNKYVLEQLDDFGWFSGFFLEKVGGYEWFLPLGKIIIPEADGPIRCYHDNETNINFTSKDCEYRIVNSLDNSQAERFEMFPNPSSNTIHIKSDLRIDTIEVIDYSGHIILHTKETDLNISSLTSGVYFVKIISNNTLIMKMLIKE